MVAFRVCQHMPALAVGQADDHGWLLATETTLRRPNLDACVNPFQFEVAQYVAPEPGQKFGIVRGENEFNDVTGPSTVGVPVEVQGVVADTSREGRQAGGRVRHRDGTDCLPGSATCSAVAELPTRRPRPCSTKAG